MKILAKLLFSFIGLALLCGIVGFVGLTQLGNTKTSILKLSEETIPKLDYINRIDRCFRTIKTAVRTLSVPEILDDDTYYREQLTNIATARTSYAEAKKLYEATQMTGQEKKYYDAVLAALQPAIDYNNLVLATVEKARVAPAEERAAISNQIYGLISGEKRLAMDNLLSSFADLLAFDQQYYGIELPKQTLKGVDLGRLIVLNITILAFIVALVSGLIQGITISRRLNRTVRVLDKIAHGDLTEQLDIKSIDEFQQVKASVNGVEHNIQELISDTGMLVQSAIDGRLSVRADPERHQGDYRRVIEGINDTLNAVVTPLAMAAGCIDRISKGDIPEKITDSYNGDFNRIKDNLNIAIDSIKALVSDTMLLTDAAVSGALQTRADASKHQGDYRKIIDGINTTLDLMITPINETISVMKHVADGDLSLRITGDYRGDFDVLKTALNESLEAINDTLGQISTAVEQVAEGAVQVSQASQALSQGATEQAASLEEITSSTTEISGQTRQNTENALKMNSLAREAQENAEKGNTQMKDLVSAMSDINTSAEEIKKVVNTIDDISFQINLLALNANVEAARAGKYGKGFAVVAEEVRNLAVRSANSVKDTTRMVDEAINNIHRGNVLVDGTASQLDEIVGGASQVSVLAEEVATAGREQTQGLDQISLGLNQIDQVTQSNTASAEESASASEELSSQAQQVKSMLSRFRLKVSEAKKNNEEVIAMLRAELAQRDKGHSRTAPSASAVNPGVAAISGQSAALARPAAVRQASLPRGRSASLDPADIISLDDSNFGKF